MRRVMRNAGSTAVLALFETLWASAEGPSGSRGLLMEIIGAAA
jgi:hypothetical protein